MSTLSFILAMPNLVIPSTSPCTASNDKALADGQAVSHYQPSIPVDGILLFHLSYAFMCRHSHNLTIYLSEYVTTECRTVLCRGLLLQAPDTQRNRHSCQMLWHEP